MVQIWQNFFFRLFYPLPFPSKISKLKIFYFFVTSPPPVVQELEQQLEKNGINVPPCTLPLMGAGAFSPSSSGNNGKAIKQEPQEDAAGANCSAASSFSPSSTPQTTKIATSLQEMQITSPLGVQQQPHGGAGSGHHATLLKLAVVQPGGGGGQQQHGGGAPFMIGSAPSDMSGGYMGGAQQQQQGGGAAATAGSNSGNGLNFLQQRQQQQQQQAMEFGEAHFQFGGGGGTELQVAGGGNASLLLPIPGGACLHWPSAAAAQSQLGQMFGANNYGELSMEEFAFQVRKMGGLNEEDGGGEKGG